MSQHSRHLNRVRVPRPPPRRPDWIPNRFSKEQIKEKARDAMAKHKLVPRTENDVVTQVGSRLLANKNCYKCHYTNFSQFCMMVGDYDSLVIMDDHCPDLNISIDLHRCQDTCRIPEILHVRRG
jgi:hypothetical protein